MFPLLSCFHYLFPCVASNAAFVIYLSPPTRRRAVTAWAVGKQRRGPINPRSPLRNPQTSRVRNELKQAVQTQTRRPEEQCGNIRPSSLPPLSPGALAVCLA